MHPLVERLQNRRQRRRLSRRQGRRSITLDCRAVEWVTQRLYLVQCYKAPRLERAQQRKREVMGRHRRRFNAIVAAPVEQRPE